ncbi:MAG: hypothetical protein NZ890_04410 [Myxococcota bacterium]|nr:hypothetical protein [Myxococcota bacterium]
MDWRPALRPDLQRLPPEPGGAGGQVLLDPVLNRRIVLGPASCAMVPLLDGTHPLQQVLAQGAAAPGGGGLQGAERALRAMLLLYLIEGVGQELLERARAVQGGLQPLEPVFLPETRFACQGSGDCCRSTSWGPLTEADVARLEALPIEEHYPYLGPGPYVEQRPMADGTQRPFLRTFGQQCIFQLPDRRCGLQVAFGAEAKPALCRLYPYQQLPTLFGRLIYDRSECATFALSACQGPTLEQDLPRVLALLPPPQELYHPQVLLEDDLPCDYGLFYRLQQALLRALEVPGGGPGGRLLLYAAWLRAFLEGLARVALAPGEPERTLQAVLAAPPPVGEPAGEPGLVALATVAAALRQELLPHQMGVERAGGRRIQPQLMELDEALGAIQALALEGAGGPRAPERLARLRAVAADDPAIDEALRRSLRNQIVSDRALVGDRPRAGLVRAAMVQLVALTRARQLAAGRGAPQVGLGDFNAGHALAVRLLNQERLHRVFVAHEAQALDMAAAVPLVM